MSISMKPKPISQIHKKRRLASFYTPQDVAQILTDWAIVDARSTVLDPSYGGCAFLNASRATLLKKGNNRPGRQIYGVDVDPEATRYLAEMLASGALPHQYVQKDFFLVETDYFNGQLFDTVVGNPPYIRYHDIPEIQQKRAKRRLEQFNMRISGRASYWAFFLLYSMQFLRRGGRLAMLLPGALLHTDYSGEVREFLTKNFEQVTIYLLQERIFEDTEEESVLVCAEGAGKPHQRVRIGTVATVKDLQKAFADIDNNTRALQESKGDGGWLRALVDTDTLHIYDEIIDGPNVIRLGDWLTPRIGTVTGNNRFFILSPAEQAHHSIPDDYFIPVVRRPAHFSGLVVKNEDFRFLKEQGKEYLLLNPPEKLCDMPGPLRQYIQKGKKAGVHLAQKCQARNPWYVVPHTFVPEAFIPCMVATWPRLIVNQSQFTCTNNILRLSWKKVRPASDWLRLALGTLSSLSQLSAELVGRSYGGGVLKVEPTELTHLAVPLVAPEQTEQLSQKVDLLLRQNKAQAATRLVDEALLNDGINLSRVKLDQLRLARNKLFFRRRQHRKDVGKIVELD